MQVDHKNIYYPPGGILLWIIIFLELITFGIALVAMAYSAKQDPQLFHESRLQLNVVIGTINTILLLTSGFFMANTVHEVKQDNIQKAKRQLLFTVALGLFFLILKSLEYSAKLDAGLDMGANTFFSYYWMLTLFHVIHVIVGLFILGFFYRNMSKKQDTIELGDIEAGAAFWHMCDLIWLLLFPVIYLIF